ncbi:hypothetical protein ACFL45_07790 [Candidatus Neomarinimicrobiota bacterium]
MRSVVQYILFCLILSPLGAQLISEDGGTDISHKWALQLKMPDLITGTVWNGNAGSISLQRGLSNWTALRIGLDLSLLSKTDKRWYDVSGIQISDIPTPVKELTLQAHFLLHTPCLGASRFYLGGGPLFSVGREHETKPKSDHDEDRTMWAWGVEAVIGFSAVLTPKVNLFAEYKLRFARQHYKVERWVDYGPETVLTETYAEKVRQAVPRSAIPLFGVSLYFK